MLGKSKESDKGPLWGSPLQREAARPQHAKNSRGVTMSAVVAVAVVKLSSYRVQSKKEKHIGRKRTEGSRMDKNTRHEGILEGTECAHSQGGGVRVSIQLRNALPPGRRLGAGRQMVRPASAEPQPWRWESHTPLTVAPCAKSSHPRSLSAVPVKPVAPAVLVDPAGSAA